MSTQSQIEIYTAKDGTTQINVQLEQDTVWLTQAQMGQLFDKNKRTISEHIRNIFKEGELEEKVVVREFRTTTQHGAMVGKTQTSSVKLYNLDVIISVGYRVKSHQGTQFRIWANGVLKDYLVKGYAINEKRLAQKEQEVHVLKEGIQILSRAIVDGNKRIAAACFLMFLQQNDMLFNKKNQPLISNDTLASLTLFIVSSKPEEMETVKRLVISVLNRNQSASTL